MKRLRRILDLCVALVLVSTAAWPQGGGQAASCGTAGPGCVQPVAALAQDGGQKVQPAPAAPAVPGSWKQIPIPPLHPFKPQEPRRVQLANGMVIFLQEDHELPLIDGSIHIRGGSRDEPADKAGLTAIYSEVWRTGGTKSKTGDELDDFLESHAARVEAYATDDSTSVNWSSLDADFDQVFSVVLDMLENPEFREDKVELAKQQLASVISRRNDELDEITRRESVKLAYGPDSPYARTPEYHTISAV